MAGGFQIRRAGGKPARPQALRGKLRGLVESSGGPWNTVTNAMQRLTSSETHVKGFTVFDAVLPPPPTTLDKLISWTTHTNDGVRYFFGTATYEKEIEISADALKAGRELWLDLGAVKHFAEVSRNEKDLGVVWKLPFRVNLSAAAKSGANKLIVKVTNLWPNRLIGDEQLPPDCEWNGLQLKAWPQWLLDGKPSPTGRLTFTTWHHWEKDSRLLGLVTLRNAELIPAQ